jgi:hypothetical protein
MDPETAALAAAAAATMVELLTTEAWQKAKSAIGGLWRRARSTDAEAVDVIDVEIAETRVNAIAAREAEDDEAERELVGAWQARLSRLLAAEPALVPELRRLLDDTLTPALDASVPGRTTITMRAKASDDARIYQAGGDQHINEGR